MKELTGAGEPYQPKPAEIAGFELCGWRQHDGSIRLGPASVNDNHGTKLAAWPKEVHVCGMTYTLERETWQTNGFGWGTYV